MTENITKSAGLLMYRMKNGEPEIFLVHHGGPLWEGTDLGAWSIPKGWIEEGESPFDAACREFEEETGFAHVEPYCDLGSVEYVSKTNGKGKIVFAWAFLGDADPAKIKSNTCEIEWPKGSGKIIRIPEVDKADFFPLEVALQKIYPDQKVFLERLLKMIKKKSA